MHDTDTRTLRPWAPRPAWDDDDAKHREPIPVRQNDLNLLVELHADVQPCDLTTLSRAAELSNGKVRLFEPAAEHAGEPWYDSLGRITSMWIDYEDDAGRHTLRCPRKILQEVRNGSPDTIRVHYEIRWGKKTRTVGTLRTDFAVADECGRWPDNAGILVTPDAKLSVDELGALLRHAIFRPAEDDDSGWSHSVATEKADFAEQAHAAACRLLMDPDSSAEAAIRYAVREHLEHLFPKDRGIEIRHDPAGGGTSILMEPVKETAAHPTAEVAGRSEE